MFLQIKFIHHNKPSMMIIFMIIIDYNSSTLPYSWCSRQIFNLQAIWKLTVCCYSGFSSRITNNANFFIIGTTTILIGAID